MISRTIPMPHSKLVPSGFLCLNEQLLIVPERPGCHQQARRINHSNRQV
jgi:hypothetical protein